MWSWLQPLSRVSECFSVESAFWMDSANHRSPTISKPSWQSCGLCVHIEARTVFLPPMSHCWSRPPSIFLASSVKQSHNERTSTVFHWSHKCTKMRLRRVTSLDSPGQTGRVLHCVGQRSSEKKKKKKKVPMQPPTILTIQQTVRDIWSVLPQRWKIGICMLGLTFKRGRQDKKGLFMYSSFLTSKISNLIIFWDHESGQKWVTVLKKRKKKFYFKNVDVSELLLSFIKVSHSLFVFSIWRNLTMKLYTCSIQLV